MIAPIRLKVSGTAPKIDSSPGGRDSTGFRSQFEASSMGDSWRWRIQEVLFLRTTITDLMQESRVSGSVSVGVRVRFRTSCRSLTQPEASCFACSP